MRCNDCLPILEEYLDRELDSSEQAEVEAHLAGCQACSAALGELEREQAVYARYERPLEIRPDMWAAIDARIRQEKPAKPGLADRIRRTLTGLFTIPNLSPAFAAGLVILAVAVTAAVMNYIHRQQGGTSVQVAVEQAPPAGEDAGEDRRDQENRPETRPSPDKRGAPETQPVRIATARKPSGDASTQSRKPTPEQLVREAEQKYHSAIAMLTRDVNRRRSQLDPEVLAHFDSSMKTIDQTIAETREAVRQHPNDPVAVQYMLVAYSRKVELLREIASL